MKKFDLVELQNIKKEYLEKNLIKGMHGVIIESNYLNSRVLFFNEQNIGEYALVKIANKDLFLEKEKLPNKVIKELQEKFDIEKFKNDKFEKVNFKEYDKVELLVEEERYAKFGVHKGDVGFILEKQAVKNYILVDFQKIDKHKEIAGDVVSVKLSDLKNIENK